MLEMLLVAQISRAVEMVGNGKIDWAAGYVIAKSYGVFDPAKANPADILKARRVATVVAQRNLLETIKGVHVNSTTVVEDFMLKSDLIVTHVEGVVKNSRILSESVDRENGIVEVELMAPLNDIAQAILDEIAEENKEKKEKSGGKELKKVKRMPSAVILDASSSDVKPSMLPRIYDSDGNLILDLSTLIDPENPKTKKIVKVVDDLNDILSDPELKDNPLVLKVIKALNERDVVVDDKSARYIRWIKALWNLGKKVALALF